MVEINELAWEPWNITHIARHNIVQKEVIEVCKSTFILLKGNKGRIVVIGTTYTGRLLSIVLDLKQNGVYYVVTARPAAKKERLLFYEKTNHE